MVVAVAVGSALQHLDIFRVGAGLAAGQCRTNAAAQDQEDGPVGYMNERSATLQIKPNNTSTYTKPTKKGQVSARWNSVPTKAAVPMFCQAVGSRTNLSVLFMADREKYAV